MTPAFTHFYSDGSSFPIESGFKDFDHFAGPAVTESASAPFTVPKPEIPGLDSKLSKPKPKKEKKVKQSPVELPKLDNTEFVPPPIALRRCDTCRHQR